MKTCTILLNLLLAVSSVHADEFKFDTPVSYHLVYDQSVKGKSGNEAVDDSWKYELDFDLVIKKSFDQGNCIDVTLRRFILILKNAKGIWAEYDSSTPDKSIPKELNDLLDSSLFLNFPSRYEQSRNGKLTAEKNNHPFQQYLKDLGDKSSVALIKEVMQATGNFWILNEKYSLVSILNSIFNSPSSNKGGQQSVTLQAMPLFATFPLSKWPFLRSFEKALCLKTPSCILFTSESSSTKMEGSWKEDFSTTIQGPNRSIEEKGTCEGNVIWDQVNYSVQKCNWSWENDVSDVQNPQTSLKFCIKQTIEPKEQPKS